MSHAAAPSCTASLHILLRQPQRLLAQRRCCLLVLQPCICSARPTHATPLDPPGGQLGGVKLSQDHRLMAYSLEMDSQQQEAAEQYCCVVRDLHAGAAATCHCHASLLHVPGLHMGAGIVHWLLPGLLHSSCMLHSIGIPPCKSQRKGHISGASLGCLAAALQHVTRVRRCGLARWRWLAAAVPCRPAAAWLCAAQRQQLRVVGGRQLPVLLRA